MFALAILIAIALYKKHDTRDFYTILFTSTTAMFVTYTIKYTLSIKRPADALVTLYDPRFPSGHATMSALVMSLGIYYAHLHLRNKYLRYTVYSLAVIWYLLVSYSRLYLHVHYPIDVIVGGAIGVASTIVVVKIFKHFRYYK